MQTMYNKPINFLEISWIIGEMATYMFTATLQPRQPVAVHPSLHTVSYEQ
jgi:hypothetical protein